METILRKIANSAKTNLGKSKHYLASLNPPLAKEGKGRLSLAAKAHLDKRIKAGDTFDDYPKGAPVVKRNGKAVRKRLPRAGEKVFRNSKKVVDDLRGQTFPPGTRYFVPVSINSDKVIKVSNRTSCAICRYALDYCECGMPSVWRDGKALRLEVR
jgi:hypothetical protein